MTVRLVALSGDTATIGIFGEIGYWDDGDPVDADMFIESLAQFEKLGAKVVVQIDSIGGSYVQGVRIAEAIKAYPFDITTLVIGQAYSMASLIFFAGKRREILASAAGLMIHKVWAENVSGTEEKLREVADMLAEVTAQFAEDYKLIGSIDAMPYFDGNSHYFDPQQSLALGFCDAVIDEPNARHLASAKLEFKPRTILPCDQMIAGLRACLQTRGNITQPAAAAAPSKEEITMADKPKPQPAAPANPETATVDTAAAALEAAKTQLTPETAAAVAKLDAEAAASEALAKEYVRRSEIRVCYQPFLAQAGIEKMMNAALDDHKVPVEKARADLLQALGRNSQPLTGLVMTTEHEADKYRIAVASGLMIRAGLTANDQSNEFRGYSLLELARAQLQRNNISTKGMDKMAVVAAAFTTTSDFANILSNVAEKAMLKGYEEADETFQKWTSAGTLPDFKSASRVDLNTFPALQKVIEGAEYHYVSVGDHGENIQLATYGNLFAITRQAIINDDINVFTRVPNKMGRAAIRTVGNLVYAVLTSNPNMSDGVALFEATNHKNYTSSGTVISSASVDLASATMATQTDPTGNVLNINMAYLIVPRSLRGLALQTANAEFEVGSTTSTKNNTVPNYVRGSFEVISDARLDGSSTTAWYAAANPNVNDTIEVAYLDGNQTPTLEQQKGWTIDGVEFKVRIDAAVKALDYRAMYKNAGA